MAVGLFLGTGQDVSYKIGWGEHCLTPTDYPFCKLPQDVESKVKIMTGEISKKITSKQYIKNYFKLLKINEESNNKFKQE